MNKIMVIGMMSILLYAGITSFDSLINTKAPANKVDAATNGFDNSKEVYHSIENNDVITSSSYEYNPILVTNDVIDDEQTAKNQAPTVEELKQASEVFFNELIQPTNDEYEVENYKSILELKQHLMDFASLHVISYFVDELYEEVDGKLLIIPMDSPPWIMEENPAEIIKVSANEYILSQTNQSELHGNYKITISFKRVKDNWKITNVQIGNAI